ncbi:hypothetical protein SAMN04489844_1825 [Nocardioides exalbidus]|uniref:WD40-like Beta Propeller Repeat n=1 Tax=Nocardioides exalbidus TaxID=402596 RepID=A0A1H4QDR1_9ACTN|nr:hypothetical protein [Nocardioides exalbidus]SEC17785.1 hypothetical protein SAMN04489844_1825 [Nocardioides exalbidus]
MSDLRTNLQRLADSADPLPVDDDLWQRGQASRRRGQALVVAAVLAIIASVTWSAVLLGTGDREARTASTDVVPGGAIPSRIDDIPSDLEVTTQLDLGLASAAFISSTTSDPVVITATDGVPHRLGLPGWIRDGTELGERVNQSLALSPDGTRLAWQAADSDDGHPVIGVLDLSTGEWKAYAQSPGAGIRLREMSWSPDSAWLAWIADDLPNVQVGRLRPGSAPQSDVTALTANIQDVAVSADGTLVISRPSGGLYEVEGDDATRLTRADGVGAGRFSPDGRQLSLRSGIDPTSFTLDLATGKVLEHPFPAGTFEDAAVLQQGWLDDRLQLLLVQSSAMPDQREMVVTTPTVGPTSTWRRSVGLVEAGPAVDLSLAVDLVPDLDGTSSQQLTHDFGDPFGSDPRDLSWIIGLGVAAAIAVLMALRWLLRRLLG